jgi:hypothetical protein
LITARAGVIEPPLKTPLEATCPVVALPQEVT